MARRSCAARIWACNAGELGFRLGEQRDVLPQPGGLPGQLIQAGAENDDSNDQRSAPRDRHDPPHSADFTAAAWIGPAQNAAYASIAAAASLATDSASHSGDNSSTCPAEPRTSARTQAGSATRTLIWRWPSSIAVSSVTG